MSKMNFGSKRQVEPGIIQFEDGEHSLEVTTLPGKRPHFAMEYKRPGESNGVVINPAQVLNKGNFGPDSKKMRRFYEGIDDGFLDTVREQLQKQDLPSNDAEKEIYYATLALLHTPMDEPDLIKARRMNKEKGRKDPKRRKDA